MMTIRKTMGIGIAAALMLAGLTTSAEALGPDGGVPLVGKYEE